MLQGTLDIFGVEKAEVLMHVYEQTIDDNHNNDDLE
jgi:hypothetical protein